MGSRFFGAVLAAASVACIGASCGGAIRATSDVDGSSASSQGSSGSSPGGSSSSGGSSGGAGDTAASSGGGSRGPGSSSGSAASCGGQGPTDAQDAGAPADEDAPSGPPCTTTSDCEAGLQCLYLVGSCAAQGHCLPGGSLGPQCNLVVAYCGCNDASVGGLCGPPYAYGPTIGVSAPCGPAAVVPPGATLTTLAESGVGAFPAFLAVDESYVYWTNTGKGTVERVAKCGGTPRTLASGLSAPEGIAIDATSIYVVTEGASAGSVVKLPLGGGAVTTLATSGPAYAVAVDDANVYWTSEAVPGTRFAMNALMRVPIGGGTATTVATGDVFGGDVALDATNVYWLDGSNVMQAPKGGGAAITVASGRAFPYALAVDAANVYWTENRGGIVGKAPIGGGMLTTLATTTGPEGIAVDGTSVYWVDDVTTVGTGRVLSVPVGGGAMTTLATGQRAAERVKVDATSVYWVDTELGAVMKLTPK